jgi:DeoR/GlpR family transcriptional regulator of sugar metabolism
VEIARNLRARIRDISAVVGLTNRTVQAIVADLETAGYLTRTRAGAPGTPSATLPYRRRSAETITEDSSADQAD